MSLDRVIEQLGRDHVEWVRRQDNPLGCCRGRARGMWDANILDSLAAYESLAIHLESEGFRT